MLECHLVNPIIPSILIQNLVVRETATSDAALTDSCLRRVARPLC